MNYPTIEVSSIVMHDGKVLIGKPKGGQWETPGGEIMPFEEMKSAAIRWAFEVSGLTTDPQNVIFVSETVKEKEKEHRVVIYLYANYIEGELKPSGGRGGWEQAEWVDVRKLGDYQDRMSELTVDAFYKFSVILRQSAARSGAQA